jgi:hypothetical protein
MNSRSFHWRPSVSALGSFGRKAGASIAERVRQAMAEAPSAPTPRWEYIAFAGALLVYAITRFWRLADYPAYFFCDEAFQPLAAERLLRHGFRDDSGRLFPLYFWNDAWAPLLPVYAHVVTVKLFGRSVEVARATAAAFTMLGAAAIGLILKLGLRSRLWWAGPLFLATTPIFFQRSRSTFETVFAASFFACFILFYVLYRCRSPWFLYPTILFAACAFYSYTLSQVLTTLTGAVLGVVDVRYHVRQWRHVLAGLALIALVALPLYRFRRDQPSAARDGLARTDSFWVAKNTLGEKIRRSAKEYSLALSPRYWFFPDDHDGSRHAMAGYSHIPTAMLPFFGIGVAVCLWRIRSPAHRTILICSLTAAFGGFLTLINSVRLLAFVVPAVVLIVIGASFVFELVQSARVRAVICAGLFALLSASTFHLLYDALTNDPGRYKDYGLYGQQWGAKEVFGIVTQYLKADPENRIMMTSSWANGAHLFTPFFLTEGSPEESRVTGGSWQEMGEGKIPPSPKKIFVMTQDEMSGAQSSGRFSAIRVDRVLDYPNGAPGFYFARLELASNIAEILARDREKLRTLIDGQVVVRGETLSVRHYQLDMGNLEGIFDADPETMGRFNADNPTVMEVRFPSPRPIHNVILRISPAKWEINLWMNSADKGASQHYMFHAKDQAPDPIEIPIDKGPAETAFLRLEIRNLDIEEHKPSIVHLHGLEFR